MVSPNQLSSWRPDTLRDISDDIARRRKALLEQSDELESAKVPTSSYSFESAQPAQRAHDNLASTLATQISEATAIIKALDAAASSIDSAKRSLEGAYSMTLSSPLSINGETGYVSVTRTAKDSSDAQYLYTQRNYAQQFVDDALSSAAAADEALAAAFTTATTSDVNSVGTLDQQRKIMEFLQRTPAGQVDYLMKHPEEYALMGDHLSPDVKERLGQQVAAELDDVARDPALLRDKERVEKLTELVTGFGHDPAVMAPMYERLGPDGLMATFSNAEKCMMLGRNTDELGSLATELRSGLEAASQSPDFDGEKFGSDLVRYTTHDVTAAERKAFENAYGSGSLNSDGDTATLDFLLRKGEYGEDFVRGVAWELDEFDRSFVGGSGNQVTIDAGKSPLGYLGCEKGYEPDPMAHVMTNLSKHPELGLEFFSEGDAGKARSDFYFAERNWGNDDFTGISEAALAIGTDPDNLKNSHHSTSMFVSEFFDKVSDNPTFTADDASGASEPVAKLLKSYMPSVDAAIQGGAGKEGAGTQDLTTLEFAPQLFDYPKMDQSDLDKLLNVALSTDDGMARVAEGVAGFRQQRLALYADANPGFLTAGDPNYPVQQILERSAQLDGYMQNSVAESAVADAKDKDEQVAMYTGLVSDAIGLIPAGKLVEGIGSDLVGGVWDAAWGRMSEIPTDAITETWGSTADSTAAKQNTESLIGNEGVQIRTTLALAQAGLIEIPSSSTLPWEQDGTYISLADMKKSGQWQQYANEAASINGSCLSVSGISSVYKEQFGTLITK